MKSSSSIAVLACLGLSACCSSPQPSAITLRDALQQVQSGIVEMQQSQKKAGLVVSQASVTFNITESRDKNGNLSLNLSPMGSTIAGGSVGGSITDKRAASNTITVTFQNVFTADKDTVAGIAVTPTAVLIEETTTTVKEGGKETTTVVKKTPTLTSAMTVQQLYDYIQSLGIITVTR